MFIGLAIIDHRASSYAHPAPLLFFKILPAQQFKPRSWTPSKCCSPFSFRFFMQSQPNVTLAGSSFPTHYKMALDSHFLPSPPMNVWPHLCGNTCSTRYYPYLLASCLPKQAFLGHPEIPCCIQQSSTTKSTTVDDQPPRTRKLVHRTGRISCFSCVFAEKVTIMRCNASSSISGACRNRNGQVMQT